MSGVLSWIERRLERAYPSIGPLSSFTFWAITALVAVSYANVVKTVMRYRTCLPAAAFVETGSILVLYPLTWVGYYRLRRRFQRFSQEGMSAERMREIAHFWNAFVVTAYLLLVFCFSIIKDLLACLAKGRL